MRNLLVVCSLLLLLPQTAKAAIRISGTPSWAITKPNCTFEMVGAIENSGTPGTVSGSLKMVLWATSRPFPSRGYVIAELPLGQMAAGSQLGDFSERVAAKVPRLTGEYHFTVVILEFTTAGWRTRDFRRTGSLTLENGDFMAGGKWTVPAKAVIAPPRSLPAGSKIVLTPRANFDLDLITPGTDSKTTLSIFRGGVAIADYGGNKSRYPFRYGTGRSLLNGQSVRSGKLSFTTGNDANPTAISLFFFGAKSGVYRKAADGQVSWGVFSFSRKP